MMQQWYKDAKLGVSMHWGIYSVDGVIESWPFHEGEIPYDVYMKQCEGFTASKYNPEDWAEMIKKAGAKYAVITTKHHDGVALWDTKANDLSVVKKTPAARDLIGPYCEAMRKAGLRVGLYFSHLDWSHPDYRSIYHPDELEQIRNGTFKYNEFQHPCDGKEHPEKWERFLLFHRTQIRELMTNYGTIDLLASDGQWERTSEQWKASELLALLHELNPEIVLNGRLCGYGDYDVPEQGIPIVPCSRQWEFWFTVNDSWGYRPVDKNYKSVRQLIRMFADCIGMGGNVNLNVAPMEDGTIDPEQEALLLEFGKWLIPNSEAVYETVGGLPAGHFNGSSTLSKDKTVLYLFYYDRPLEALPVKGVYNDIRHVSVLKTGKALSHVKNGGMPPWNIPPILWIDLPEVNADEMATVLKVELVGELSLYHGCGLL